MFKLCSRWALIKKVLKSKNVIVITLDDDEFDYHHDGISTMFAQLYMRLCQFIPNWRRQWHDKNSVS